MRLEPVAGLRVVDLFAGCGSLGIEALSRGAAFVDFVEEAKPALAALAGNLDALGLRDRSEVRPMRLPGALRRLAAELAGADLVLMDPPYGGEPARAVLRALGARGMLPAGCRVVVERHAKDELPAVAGVLARVDERRYGETVVAWYEARPAGAGAEGDLPT